jgi:uncharacterized protein YceK
MRPLRRWKNCVKDLLVVTASCCLLVVCSGCASVLGVYGGLTGNIVREAKVTVPWVYCGVVTDWYTLGPDGEAAAFAFYDLPLSFCADTALLPFTLYAQAKWGNLINKVGTEACGVDQHKSFQQGLLRESEK